MRNVGVFPNLELCTITFL